MKRSSTSLVHRLLCELIAIPSVNPAFESSDGQLHRTGERALAEFLLGLAQAKGLSAEIQNVAPRRNNFLARLEPRGKVRQRVLLAPHLDTVGAIGGQWDPFCPVRRDGRIIGRGACDTKGSIAAMFTALERVATSGKRPAQTEIVMAGLVDEENAQAGSRALVSKGFRADLAIVGEPTSLSVVTAHKGDLWFRLDTHGKSAHGSRPELGRNAVHAMARVVDLLETEYAAQLRTRRHRLLGRATVSVGSIHGGLQPNIVPAECFITVDRRTLPGETESAVRKEIEELLTRHGLEARLSMVRTEPCEPLETSPSLPLVRQLFRAARQTRPVGVVFFCDAAVLAQGGIPSVVFGPGDIAQAHTVGEWIAMDSLEQATSILERFLRSLP